MYGYHSVASGTAPTHNRCANPEGECLPRVVHDQGSISNHLPNAAATPVGMRQPRSSPLRECIGPVQESWHSWIEMTISLARMTGRRRRFEEKEGVLGGGGVQEGQRLLFCLTGSSFSCSCRYGTYRSVSTIQGTIIPAPVSVVERSAFLSAVFRMHYSFFCITKVNIRIGQQENGSRCTMGEGGGFMDATYPPLSANHPALVPPCTCELIDPRSSTLKFPRWGGGGFVHDTLHLLACLHAGGEGRGGAHCRVSTRYDREEPQRRK